MNKMHFIGATMFVVFMSHIAFATVITVNGDGTADYQTIQEAIDVASDGDEIIVAAGTYTSSSNVVNTSGKEIWLHSSDGAATTILDGENKRRVIVCSSGETSLTIIEGFTITHGLGGMWCTSSPTILGCVFTNNINKGEWTSGGGASCVNGLPMFENCSFYENHAAFGGGLSLNGSCTLLNCFFAGNTASYGGGAADIANGNHVLTGCTFTSNSATNYGGAIRVNSSSSATMTDCIFTSNTASGGGAISNEQCTPILNNCDFYSNSSTGGSTDLMSGGAIANYIGHVELDGCTFATNTSYYGGGLWNHNGTVELTDCDFDSNTAQQGGGVFNSHSSAVMSGCTLENNTALNYSGYTGGGAIYSQYSSISLTDSLLENNSADNGGGMFSLFSAEPTIMINCSVTNNTAKTNGGGLCCMISGTVLKNCTSSGNEATQGLGVYIESHSMYKFIGTNFSDEIYMRNWSQPDARLVLDTDSTCDVTGDVSTSFGGSTHFDINNLSADEQLKVSNNFFRQGALGITNESGSLSDSAIVSGTLFRSPPRFNRPRVLA